MDRRISFLFAVIFIITSIVGCNSSQDTGKKQAVPEVPKTQGSIEKQPDKSKLTGKWVRSDGSYTIEIISVSDAGKADAAYYNPNPVNVEKAEWKVDANRLFFRIILRDVNYPGSNYTLEYVPERDMLTGNYFQAVEGTNYDVIFTRVR